jgi:MFS transporter, SP family, galactose:H+ symporter
VLFKNIFLVSIFSGLVVGYNSNIISGAILFISRQFHFGSISTEGIISASLWGGLIAVIFANIGANYLGRKTTMILSTFLISIGPIMTVFEYQLGSFELGRGILGLGLGLSSIVVPLYLVEVTPAAYRGKILAAGSGSFMTGCLFSNVVEIAFSKQANWKIMLLIGSFLAFVELVGLFFIPNSPMDKTKISSVAWINFITCPVIRFSLFLGLVIGIMEKATGIGTVSYYAPILIEQAGVTDPVYALVASLLISLVGILMAIYATIIIDRVGRKPLLQFGLKLMMLSLFAVGVGFLFPSNMASSLFVTTSLFIYSASFNVSLGTLVWVLIPEVFPTHYRAKGISLILVLTWASNAIISQFFLSLIALLGDAGLFFLFAAITLASYAFVKKYVRETCAQEINI